MALQRIEEFYPNYREEIFAGDDIKGFDVYAGDSDEKIGSIYDALVDETGRFRYLVIDTGIWIFGKKVLLPIGSARFDYGARRVYATGLFSKEQAEQLPAYNELEPLDYDREEQVRDVYRGTTAPETASNLSTTNYDRSNYSYDLDRPLYETNEQNHQTFKLYEERLIANKNRAKTGEVAVGKRVESEVARASVPIEKERVVIERVTPVEAGRVVSVGEVDFQSGEVARMEVYEETADIHKEAYVREEVSVRKEVVRSTVDGEETLRREELDVQTDGTPVVDNKI
ncbi:MAG: DUF2382 domain-containing protein [Oscillatoriales cyanobacterium]|uniref:DUF2382 domain-containing protein n=1 Tax=Microcoleus anatoxicus PTRS2 TaxID=2705321 RepID=A0ABU8YH37_9CYAN|nr:MAG: DUF2382 domain-containing protein [Oscillatoriales cyanobacterium]TAD96580.1 MAG: DUF2382 domain-containing protein [Oscillatoriales cyanobacterium]TAE04229.1 MAG: DUF2382 domain-containing protein [Oscillatoriales cyanobacterium]TAF02934.1 MAG: DUF2382 domain-containing protein [Oscillatoriales cyanobacterium]TAF40811.1 MAG: DUF2382 domain-containing protein [Oscillatoriales cyanobacterium]